MALCRALEHTTIGDRFVKAGSEVSAPLAQALKVGKAIKILRVYDAPEDDAPQPPRAGTADMGGAPQFDRMMRKPKMTTREDWER